MNLNEHFSNASIYVKLKWIQIDICSLLQLFKRINPSKKNNLCISNKIIYIKVEHNFCSYSPGNPPFIESSKQQ